MIYISPSLLSARLENLESSLKLMYESNADYAHVDVMDGTFVPNIAFGPSFVEAIKKVSLLPLDVHLMIVNPFKYVTKFLDAGSDIITMHVEAISEEDFIIAGDIIHKANKKIGITLKPDTDINKIVPYLKHTDLVLIMSVMPGFSGQKFMKDSLERIEFINKYRIENKLSYLIEVDGGIDNTNYQSCLDAGVDILVSGSYLFSGDMKTKIEEFKR